MKQQTKRILIISILCMMIGACALLVGCGGETSDAGNGTAPKISGLSFESEMKKDYAEQFHVYYYSDGYKLFDVEEGGKFLLVPEGKEAPSDLDESITVLQAPLDNIYMAATAQVSLFAAMDALDKIRTVSLKKNGWTYSSIQKKMESGAILFAGKYSEPDYELLLNEKCELAVESTMISHAPEIEDMLIDLGIPVLIDRSSYESNPLGRMEWIKFYGAMVDREDAAETFYASQKKKIEQLDDFENTGKTIAFFYISTDGKAVVRSTTDYIPAMIEMAGGKYAFKGVTDESGKSSVPMTIEKFYDIAEDADYVVYNASIDSTVRNKEELLAKDPIMKKLHAVENDNCWSTGNSMYQRPDLAAEMILDFHTLLVSKHPEKDVKYLQKLL